MQKFLPFEQTDIITIHADIARQYKLTTSTAIRGISHDNLPNLWFHIHHRPLLLHVILVTLLVCSRITRSQQNYLLSKASVRFLVQVQWYPVKRVPAIVQCVKAVLKTGHPLHVNAAFKIMQNAQSTLQIILQQLNGYYLYLSQSSNASRPNSENVASNEMLLMLL